MTTGQRIAAKRKEFSLSQEALGEQLGVSRQSIYKWESDSSLPEIDKLVTMSRLFSVSVGWLLGVEEQSSPEEADDGEPEQLSPAQEKMVEEILSRYQAAQPQASKPTKSPWDKWSVRILFAICGFMVASILTINSKINNTQQQYDDLSYSFNHISADINGQISHITNRVEEVLKSQNNLTADYAAELTSVDLAQNTATFSLRAVPKTYVPGMEVVFLADAGEGDLTELMGQEGPGQEFTAQITCPLTDGISLSAVFITGDTRQTQLLDNFAMLYRDSLPTPELRGVESDLLHVPPSDNGTFHLEDTYAWLELDGNIKYSKTFPGVSEPSAVQSAKVGLFQNGKLVTWMEPCEQPDNWMGDYGGAQFYHHAPLDLTVEEGDILNYAAIFTDQYGRSGVTPSVPGFIREGDEITWQSGDIGNLSDLSYYIY